MGLFQTDLAESLLALGHLVGVVRQARWKEPGDSGVGSRPALEALKPPEASGS